MMSRIGSVGSDAFTRSDRISNGVNAVMREQSVAMNPSRLDRLFGLPSSPQSTPASSVTLAFDSSEFNEEDVWGNTASDGRTHPEDSTNYGATVTSPLADAKKYDVVSKEALDAAADPLRYTSNGWRRGSRDKGLSVAYADTGRAGAFASPLHRSAAAANGSFSAASNGTASRTSSSRMIPSNYASSMPSGNRMLHQSAPVNVPDWSKILGSSERRAFPEADPEPDSEDDDDDERLPPHELVARDYARSQAHTFSMCEGAGRTLKGRDQSRVRTAVLKQTGFYNDQ